MKKVIVFKGGVETLEFFSLRILLRLEELGYDVFTFNMQTPFESFTEMLLWLKDSEAVMLTFNFIGLSGEEIFWTEENGFFFDHADIKCLNIVVDHPFYYHKCLRRLPKKYVQFCIDRTHIEYMKRYWPDVELGEFMPLAGTEIARKNGRKRASERGVDIIFTGNYTPPDNFNKHIERNGAEYAEFYRGIIDDLLENTDMAMDYAFEKHIKRDIPEATEDELRLCMENMIFIDLYVRFYMRGKVVRTLVDNGFKVNVYGAGLDRIKYKKPENLIMHGGVPSTVCLRKLGNAKISLNVMPWFKDGAHDRVLSAALNGAVNLTDRSIYLQQIFQGKEAVEFYDLKMLDRLPEQAERLLKDDELREYMSDNAYKIVKDSHTWVQRTDVLVDYF